MRSAALLAGRLALSLALLVAAPLALAAFTVPPLTGPVVDQAGMIDGPTRARLEQGLRRLFESGGTQVTVLTVPTLDGTPLEQASIQVTDQWRLGRADRDDGVLLMVARDERQVRIEVGQGREGDLTDAHSRRIIDDTIVPRFRDGDFSGGILAGVVAIVGRTDPGFDLGFAVQPARVHGSGRGGLSPLAIGLLVLLILFFNAFGGGGRGGGRRYRGRSTGWIGGGWSGGGGGGGGWSGGGGGFSGGGASGKW